VEVAGRESARHEVISVSLPRDLVRRANQAIPKSRRSRVIAAALEAFLDSVAASPPRYFRSNVR
jgi:metal-responsive CopG/Arc/MetJ family transcriptional regulator